MLLALFLLATSIFQVSISRAAGNGCSSSSPVSNAYTVTVCITDPLDGAVVSGMPSITATVNVTGTNPGVAKLIFYMDGQYLLTDYQADYTFSLPATKWVDGSKLLEVEASMKDGFSSQRASIAITFDNGISQPPVNNNSFTPTNGTTPPPGQPFTLVAVGDGASGEVNADSVTDLIASWNPNLFLYLGDVYENGSLAEFHNWYGTEDTYYGRFRSITNPIIGNHEYEGGSAVGYFDYWDNVPSYYSYDAAGWRFISLNSNCGLLHTCAAGQAEYQWLANELNTHSNPCTIAYFHHPVFNIGQEGYATSMNALWALLAQHGVDIVLTGHDHDYQRWAPLDANGDPNPSGMTEFVVGAGGHGTQHFITSDSRLAVGFDDTAPNAFGALRLQLNAEGASYQYINTDGAVLDYGSVACDTQVDSTAPTVPAGLNAASITSETVHLNWTPASDNVGVTEYDIYRGGNLLATLPAVTSYDDVAVAPNTAYTYQVLARDANGNVSGLSDPAMVTTPELLFSDGFENGDLSQWSNITNLSIQQDEVFAELYAVRGTSSGAPTYAYRPLTQTRTDLYYRLRFKILSQGANSVYLQRYRTAAGGSILGVFLSSTNRLGYRNDISGVTTTSTTTVTTGTWHELQVHMLINGAAGGTEVWLDNVRINALSKTENLGANPIGLVQLGENSAGRTYDMALDRVALSTRFINSAIPQEGAPIARNQSVNVDEDIAREITLVATDVGPGMLDYQIISPPQHGALTGTPPNVTYLPNLNHNGSDSFTFEAINGTVHSNVATVSITVHAVNDAPTGISISDATVDENQPGGTQVGLLSTTDPDPGDTFNYIFCGGFDDALFQINDNSLETASTFDYKSETSYVICIRSTDSGLAFIDKTFTIRVNNLPDSAIFADVPTDYWAWRQIESLYVSSLTGGCGSSPLVYCPATRVTRAQMAVFLLRGVHGSSFTPPAATGTVFGDVPADYWAAAWIEQLAVESISGGCSAGLYCPEAAVTRDQMAVFLLRAEHGSAYSPPPATGTVFADIPANFWAAGWIEQLVAEGITAGCGNGNYCPATPVTRDQMAVFLVKTFNLP
jgi:hypothetical protein